VKRVIATRSMIRFYEYSTSILYKVYRYHGSNIRRRPKVNCYRMC